mmetsp:Transcript_27338/g.51046  ORF Transcript_27338/g.51046 Transcript_27338/m.51046 type:complete len:99 (-) Transcript_27338:43-339(-)
MAASLPVEELGFNRLLRKSTPAAASRVANPRRMEADDAEKGVVSQDMDQEGCGPVNPGASRHRPARQAWEMHSRSSVHAPPWGAKRFLTEASMAVSSA